MTVTSMVLSDAARGMAYTLLPNDAVRVADYEVTATVRAVEEDWANADGSSDSTRWLSSAAVTVDLAAVGDQAENIARVLDSIGGLVLPWARPYLVVSDTEWASPRQIQVRFDSHSHPYEMDTYRQVQLQFKAPRGLWEDTAAQVFTVAADLPDGTGLAFTAAAGVDVTAAAGFVFPASTTAGTSIVQVGGNARPRWTARLYGPATGPKLSRDDTGQTVAFLDGLVLAPGEYVEIDSLAQTALLDSGPDASRLSLLDFASSEWFALDPGPNRLRYHATSGTAPGSIAVVTATPVWMP